ncbi:NADP-dependent oxidoreductase [Paludibacterium sp. THUN1379]|uniref:NADP-dependent oxidoreductase n=1 Tax=Paludibacterium sp. THUN1379 TaxID=3112107 RepID=UPI0030898B21|nr:NADP-dependent oxidoreductase [Paludibacterium sp. THUN1379]
MQGQWFHLIRRPDGMPRPEDFALVSGPLPDLAADEVLVENLFLSVDPYMRECMDAEWALHQPLEGRSLGRVIASRAATLPVGSLVYHRQGWRSHAVLPAAGAVVLTPPPGVPLRAWLGLLGGTGLTAYVALTRIARLQPGEDVFINAAGGGVGMAAALMARRLGAGRIVGSTGSASKAQALMAQGIFDQVVDYHDAHATEALQAALPGGAQIALENVGGQQLDQTISLMAERGRIAWVGAVSLYNGSGAPPQPKLYDVVGKSLTLQGFLVRDYRPVQGELEDWLLPALQQGELPLADTVVHGLERCADALIAMLQGKNLGKMVLALQGAAAQ